MKLVKNSKGFTLIELVIVIVILGILAVTAAPNFINLSKEARVAALDGLSGSLKTAAQLINTKAILEQKQSENAATISYSGETIAILKGYPSHSDPAYGLLKAMSLSFSDILTNNEADWIVRRQTSSPVSLEIFLNGTDNIGDPGTGGCKVRYVNNFPADGYSISVVDTDC